MTTQLKPVGSPRVHLANGVAHIQDLSTSDPDLLALLADAPDPAELILRALAFGARALAVSRVSLDARVTEKSFDELVDQLATLLNDATAQVTGTTASLLTDPVSGVHASLSG